MLRDVSAASAADVRSEQGDDGRQREDRKPDQRPARDRKAEENPGGLRQSPPPRKTFGSTSVSGKVSIIVARPGPQERPSGFICSHTCQAAMPPPVSAASSISTPAARAAGAVRAACGRRRGRRRDGERCRMQSGQGCRPMPCCRTDRRWSGRTSDGDRSVGRRAVSGKHGARSYPVRRKPACRVFTSM
jgi:hypothetical protein